VAHAFLSLDLHRLQATTTNANTASWRVMERLGMRREACLREAEFRDGQWLDTLIYGLLADEWLTAQDAAESLTLKPLDPDPGQVEQLQRVLEGAPTYGRRVTGSLPPPTAALELLVTLPPGKEPADKSVYGLFFGEQMIGCADIVRGYPDVTTTTLGLLLLTEAYQGRGLGARAYRQLEDIVRSWARIQKIRLGVLLTNAAVLPFWLKMGFRPTGECRPYDNGQITSEVICLEKAV
jgi:RimJ/RimL family protein N-acetyltransferase